VDIQGLTLNEAVEKMRGGINTPITLTIQRKDQAALDVKLVRDRIRVQSVKFNLESPEEDIGYVRVSSFTEQTQEGLERAFTSMKTKMGGKAKGYILDLRNNPGGLLDQAISVSDSFLDKGEVVSTRGRHAEETQRFSAQKGDISDGKTVVILINGGSASASEIVAGALQDHKRATIIGTRSFGKGSVQTIIPLGSQGALRLTTARYYTPAGRSIQARGIDADILIEQPLPPELLGKNVSTEGEASLKGHLTNEAGGDEGGGSSAYVPEDKTKDVQLKAAIDFLHGVKVVSNVKPEETKTDGTPETKAN
jgi:carboxyl-terminal processing protease